MDSRNTSAELHDSKLVEVAYEADTSIRLGFLTVSSKRVDVTLGDVANFFCNGMLDGNIVESIEILPYDEISEDDVKYFVGKEGRGESVPRLRQKILEKHLHLILLSPSYGAELGCICGTVRIE